jgi:hypothetical protein
MNIKSKVRFVLALMRNEQEKYAAWAVQQVGSIDDQIDGYYCVECTLPDGRKGKTLVQAPSKHRAREIARDRVMYARLAQDYSVNTKDWEARSVAFHVDEPDLRAPSV